MFKIQIVLKQFVVFCGAAAIIGAAPVSFAQTANPPVAPASQTAPQDAFKSELDLLFTALKTRQYAVIKPLLDSKAKIGDLPQGMNDVIMPQLLNQLPQPTAYAVKGVVKEGDTTRVNVVYTYANGKVAAQSVVFDAERKIVALDLPVAAKAQVLDMSGGTRETPDTFEVPFELRDHLIRVSAELNGKKGSFILDSGAPTLILNADLMSPELLKGGSTAVGVGGTVSTKAAHIDTFNWNGLKIRDFYALALPLSHLNKHQDKDFLGLIGYDVFKDYELTFDYGRKIMTLVRTDKAGEPVVATSPPKGKVSVVPFEMHRHIPVFPMMVGLKTYRMGLDSGAGENLLYAKYWSDIQKDASHLRSRQIGGIGTEKAAAKLAALDTVSVGSARYTNMAFLLEDGNLNQLNNGYQLGVDGLLGYGFLRQHITSLNYKKGEIRIYASAS